MKKRKLILLILVAAAAVLAALYFAVVRPIVNRKEQTGNEPVALLDGESYFKMNGNYSDQIPIMFPQVDREDLYEIRILSDGENYGFTHVSSGGMDYFLMWTEGTEDRDGDGILDRTLYYPELARITENFDYTTLYDETSKIPSLITGSGCVVFKDRVYIRADADPAPTDEEYQVILHRYGLADSDDPVGYEITKIVRDDRGNLMYHDGENLYCTDGNNYYDAFDLKNANYDYSATPAADLSGKTLSLLFDSVKVFVGNLLPDETGYYLRLDGRDVVYTTGTTTVGRIVYQNLAYYIHPRLAQASENQNQSYALFTTSFRVFNGTGAKDGGITATDTVLFSSSDATHNGTTPDLTGALALGSGSVPADMVEALVSSGKSVGETVPLLIGTTVEPHRALAPNKKTEYKIYAVAAVIHGGEYLDGEGGATVVAAGDQAICAYTADGAQGVGMIDLATAPAALANAIVGLTVGAGTGEPLSTATVDFTSAAIFETAVYQVESIQAYARNADFTSGMVVWDSTAKNTVQTATIPKTGARGYVAITYSVKRGGVLAVERTILSLEGGNATFAEDEMARAIRATIDASSRKLTLGYRKIPTTVQLPADPFTAYLVYRDFKIEGILGTDETIGVRFVNETERDIFHGGSAYEITSPAARTIYSVGNDGLMDVLQTVFAEAKGSETVAVGLTKENFEKYGLGAHAVYFEMPLGLTYRDGTSMDVGIRDRVGFHLYFSERKTDAEGDYYYAASDLYGIVVKAPVSVCDFSFLDWEFRSEWLDDDMLLLSLTDVRDMTFDINYSDLKETHGFAVSVNPVYHTTMADEDITEKIYVAYVPGAKPTYVTHTALDAQYVETDNRNYNDRNEQGDYYRTDYGVQVSENPDVKGKYDVRIVSNDGAIGLDQHYQNQRGGAELSRSGVTFEGVGNFTKLITLIYTSKYSGSISPDELSPAEAERIGDLLVRDSAGNYVLSDDDPAARERAVFTVTLTLIDGRVFRLAFYPASDGRYLLSFEDAAKGIVSREFYLYMGEIKNIVTAVRTVVAGGTVRYDQSYLPEPD
ncbi:MAG: hypothetical protein J5958_02445 [Clostridia bacterium]|nr:hypothetical protein [Clostridia bacterium]